MIRIATVVLDAPGATLDLYGKSAGGIAAMYAELLGLHLRSRADLLREAGHPADEGDELDPLLLSDDPTHPGIAFECETGDYRAPAWPDPDRPQQVHLDVAVPDLSAAHDVVTRCGATLLREVDTHHVYADCVGHPFCLYPETTSAVGRIERVVLDCFSPRTLAAFYEELLDMSVRVIDEPERVEIARRDGQGPKLAFQHAVSAAPRWPDPAYPQQLHLDLDADDFEAAAQLAVRLGAIRLPHMGGGFVYADPAGHPFCLGE